MKQKGFTLPELLLVIVILGILSVFIVPRFVKLEQESRVSMIYALKGNLLSSTAIVHAIWATQNQPMTVTFGGKSINLVSGYPASGTYGILNALGNYQYTPFMITSTDAKTQFQLTNNCFLTYAASENGEFPMIEIATRGC